MEKLEIVFLYLHCICKKGIFMLQYIDNKTQKGGKLYGKQREYDIED